MKHLSHFQHYSLLTQESYSDFKELLKKYINSKSLLNESIQTNLPNPFGEGVETLERKNKYVRTGREAFENLNRALNS